MFVESMGKHDETKVNKRVGSKTLPSLLKLKIPPYPI